MKLRGVIRGKIIELETVSGLPDGQHVQAELEIAGTDRSWDPVSGSDMETRIATDPAFRNVREARELRERIAERHGGCLEGSVDFIREDRSR